MVHKKSPGRPRKAEDNRHADRQILVEAALALLAEQGSAGFSARAVAERAGTAVGTVYTQFESLDALRVETTTLTMRRLSLALRESLARTADESVEARLNGLAAAYLGFAAQNRNLWMAMFERRTIVAPPPIEADTTALFAILEDVLRQGRVGDETEIPVLAKALWSSVHGMVYLAEIAALGPVHPADVPAMIALVVRATVRGLAQPQGGERKSVQSD